MKTSLNKHKRSAAGLLIAVAAFAAALTGCQKDFEMALPLAVAARELSLSKEAGSTHVLVYSNGEWTARFTRNVKWASLNKLEGYGNHEIVFTYAANYGISRKVGVVFQKGELADTVTFTQAGTVTEPSLAFAKPAVALLKAPSRIFAPIDTNLRYCIDDVEASVTYYDADGVPGEPVPVVTRAESEEGDDKPQAQPVTPWISEVAITHEGVSFAVEDNEAGSTRLADLTLFIEDAEGTATTSVLSISQGIAEPSLKLDSSVETYEGYAQQCTIPATTNNLVPYADQIVYDITYDTPVEEGNEWLSEPMLTDEGLTFSLTQNDSSEARSATLNLSYADALGASVSAVCKITQKAYPTAVDFATVRGMTPGEISLAGYIEGFVVSDPASKNIVSSPQTGQYAFDRTENDRTVYLESTDGRYGFCLKFATEDDNTLERFSKVRLSLDGAILEKKAVPECYTITGLTAANILDTSTPDEFKIPVKTKRIAELTDDDIFTLVSVPDLEIMCKDGAYTNCTDGYSLKDDVNPIGATAPRWDVTADVLRQDGRSNPHADQCGRTLAPFQLGTRSGILFGRSPRFGYVPGYRRSRRRGARPFRRPRPLPAARHDAGRDRPDRRAVLEDHRRMELERPPERPHTGNRRGRDRQVRRHAGRVTGLQQCRLLGQRRRNFRTEGTGA